MALSAKLELRQSQQLVMTPQLQQAIKLLQLSNIELTQFVEDELERNPLLERDDEGDDSNVPANGASEDVVPQTRESNDDEMPFLDEQPSDGSAPLDTEFESVYVDTSAGEFLASGSSSQQWTGTKANGNGFNESDANLEAFVASELSLKDHLSQQLALVVLEPTERLVGQYLIDLVDESGYLNHDLSELAEKLGCETRFIERVLALLQSFDPPGIFARSLGECLALQLKDLNRYDPQIAALLDNLDLLATHNIQKLRKKLDIDMDELAEMISEIKALNPKPGLKYGSVQVQTLIPDVIVRSASDGRFLVELNSETLPRVLVNRSYYSLVSKTAQSEKDKGYLVDCLQNANWLVKSLDQRARTILKVAEEIVRQQDAFFLHGVQHLRPLNLKTVADAISMHESTVSRVTSNKYMATARGIFELKYFFTSAISASNSGEAHSSEAVRFRIKQLIGNETVKSVLSDDRIVELLKYDGVDIARRTVAKYREAMGIPSSVQRRREKRLQQQTTEIV